MTRIRNSRMRRIAARMRQRGLRFQQMEESTLTFDDVAGLPDATNALKEIVDFFHNPAHVSGNSLPRLSAEHWRRTPRTAVAAAHPRGGTHAFRSRGGPRDGDLHGIQSHGARL